jgi:hypothetical protein
MRWNQGICGGFLCICTGGEKIFLSNKMNGRVKSIAVESANFEHRL